MRRPRGRVIRPAVRLLQVTRGCGEGLTRLGLWAPRAGIGSWVLRCRRTGTAGFSRRESKATPTLWSCGNGSLFSERIHSSSDERMKCFRLTSERSPARQATTQRRLRPPRVAEPLDVESRAQPPTSRQANRDQLPLPPLQGSCVRPFRHQKDPVRTKGRQLRQ